MSSSSFPIPQGTLDMLILQILSLEPAHGYGIAQRLVFCEIADRPPVPVAYDNRHKYDIDFRLESGRLTWFFLR